MGERDSRTCVRCGRVGLTAFRTVRQGDGASVDVCAHPVPCGKRRGRRQRAAARRAAGRPPTSSIAPPDFAAKRAAVIGTDAESVDILARVLEEYLALDVERLPLHRRAIEMVAARDFGIVIFDAQPGDPIAPLNDLGRRLAATRSRRAAVLVCQTVGDRTPSLARLLALTGAVVVEKPFDGGTFVDAVGSATGVTGRADVAG